MSFALTIFLSAFLLFSVQLILGKFILPWFGGAPAVWTTCILFFQFLLLLGYSYAHLLTTRVLPPKQIRVHLGLIFLSVLLLAALLWKWGSPIFPSDWWKPESPGKPVWEILKLLGVSIGFPFLLLSATSPLLQQWMRLAPFRRKPYRFYALSNAGSLLGLLAYPFLIEPTLRLSTQAFIWGIMYFIFAVTCAVSALKVFQASKTDARSLKAATGSEQPLTRATVAVWLALAALPSSMFLSVTNTLCRDVAVVPFLWVLPLAIYLLSLIVCFERDRWYHRGGFVTITAAVTFLMIFDGLELLTLKLSGQILSYSIFLFLFCMTCHGELARLKPDPSRLTWFYLVLALGGVVGSGFVGLVAPIIFKDYWEFDFILLVGWIVWGAIFARDRTSPFYFGNRWFFTVFAGLTAYLVLSSGLSFTPLRHLDFFWKHLRAFHLVGSAIMTLTLFIIFWKRPWMRSRYWSWIVVGGTVVLTGCFILQQMRHSDVSVKDVRRNFYGVVRVHHRDVWMNGQSLSALQLTHGQVNHGLQFQDPSLRREPVGYYSQDSGIELAFRFHPRRTQSLPLNISVLGLGVGTLAAFAKDGDTVRFYEINSAVSAYSMGSDPYFTYVRDCEGSATIVLGDARLSLDRELIDGRPGKFDVLIMDAFSGDSVPVHLLTKEAFEIYFRHLRDENAIIAVNISNQYLDLRELMFTLAHRFDLEAVVINSRGNPPDKTPSSWCLLTHNKVFVRCDAIQKARANYQPEREILWTDDFSNLFQLLR